MNHHAVRNRVPYFPSRSPAPVKRGFCSRKRRPSLSPSPIYMPARKRNEIDSPIRFQCDPFEGDDVKKKKETTDIIISWSKKKQLTTPH